MSSHSQRRFFSVLYLAGISLTLEIAKLFYTYSNCQFICGENPTQLMHTIVQLFISARGYSPFSHSIDNGSFRLPMAPAKVNGHENVISTIATFNGWNANNFWHFCSLNLMCQRKNYEFYRKICVKIQYSDGIDRVRERERERWLSQCFLHSKQTVQAEFFCCCCCCCCPDTVQSYRN